jgi:hypothetical protein
MATDVETIRKLDLYSPPIKWDYTGLTVIDLYQLMEYFNAQDFAKCLQEVYSYELELKRFCEDMGDWNKPVVDGWEDKKTNELLDRVRKCFPYRDFPHTSSVATRVYAFANSQCTHQDLWMRIVALRETMEDELRQRLMILVPNLKAEYCDKEEGFGEAVGKAFPSSVPEVKDACNCYALGLNTACVFHLMRVLEKGLRAMAESLNVLWRFEDWGRVIERMEPVIAAIDRQEKTPQKIADQQFYDEAATQFRYFKNAWRNHVMHANVRYDAETALRILEHVAAFMQQLSTRLSE